MTGCAARELDVPHEPVAGLIAQADVPHLALTHGRVEGGQGLLNWDRSYQYHYHY